MDMISELPDDIVIPSVYDVGQETWDYAKLDLLEEWNVSWADQVVSSYKAPTIDEFRVLFDLENRSRNSVDNWVRFAVEKRVKRLKLDFANFERDSQEFPYMISTTTLSLFNSLTSLQLAYINITGEALETLIHNCKALECLSVTASNLLVDLKVAGPSLNLKSLRIVDCFKMKTLEISAPNLVFFYFFGLKLSSFPLKSAPKLAELFIGCGYCEHLMMDFSEFSSCFSQIEVFTLDIPMDTHFSEVFPTCKRLHTLDVRFTPQCEDDLYRFSPLIKACPVLHKFVIELEYMEELEVDKMKRGTKEKLSLIPT